ncbi:hypothetical protein CPB86DRAFT_816074 [Serendipita vermifera]|nr:hypothetical protein CPB86DRAFT_816074 [Serendipita vermifera]
MSSSNPFRKSYGVPQQRQKPGILRRLDVEYPIGHYYGRTETVENLYSRLNQCRFMLIRGPPGSGKTALSRLLDQHIRSKEEDSIVFWTDAWPTNFYEQDDLAELYSGNVIGNRRVVLIIDEAQRTYSDLAVWEQVFQSILADFGWLSRRKGARAVLFTRYGPSNSHLELDDDHAPFVVPPIERASLWAETISGIDGVPVPPVGLFFSPLESSYLISHMLPDHRLDPSFIDWLSIVTAGHVGAIKDIIQFVSGIKPYQEAEDGRTFTLQSFVETVSLEQLWTFLSTSDNFSRGVPSDKILRHRRIRNILKTICLEEEVVSHYYEEPKPLKYSLTKGWIHSHYTEPVDQRFFFPTPLHHWFISFQLSRLKPRHFSEATPLDFVKRVLRRFSSSRLFSIRQGKSPFIKNQSDVNYRQEFYRVCGVSIVTFPEFVCGKGSTEFYIPSRKWAIKILHEGGEVEESSGKFSFEHYKKCMPVEDYIVLDCRRNTPGTTQADHHYYYAVFGNPVRVLDHKLSKVDSFRLRE